MTDSAPPLTIWLDGELRAAGSTHVSVLDQGLHYGTGVFEGIRCYATADGPAVFRLDAHLARMGRGARMIGFEIDVDAITGAIGDLLEVNQLEDAYIRPIAWLGDGAGLSLDVANMSVRTAVATLPLKSHMSDAVKARGIRLQTSALRRNPSSSIPTLKLCGGYVNSVIAKLRATRAGFDEALFLDGGMVVEAAAENLFMVQAGRITAVEHADALRGITRDTLLALTGARARPVSLDELREADEVFLCGTSAEVVPVTRLDDRRWDIGPVTTDLRATYLDTVHGLNPAREHWLTRFPARNPRTLVA